MLTARDLDAQTRQGSPRRKRALPSLKQQYHEYIMQRIEDYKNSLPRSALLRLGDEAASELRGDTNDQLLLTEVLMQETVDEQIKRRLKLPSQSRWRGKIQKLRKAQRDPNRWQIEATDPIARVLPRLEPGDRALVVGSGAQRLACLLAAHDVEVTCLFEDTRAADTVEGILASESLGGRCTVYVVALGQWLPELLTPMHFVALDAAAVLGLPQDRQRSLLCQLQELTAAEGLHALVSDRPDAVPEGCLHHYPDWARLHDDEPARGTSKGSRLRGLVLSGPPARQLPQPTVARNAG